MEYKDPLYEVKNNSEDYKFLEKIVDNNLFKLISDEMTYWRWNNLCRIAEMVKAKCLQRGYELENTLSETISVSLSNIIKNSSDGVIEIGQENLLRK